MPATKPLRVAVVGMSVRTVCGVRDHARLLGQALADQSVSCSLNWLTRSHRSLRGARSEVRAWRRRLESELHTNPPDAILLHYSVFSFSHKGIPLFAPPTVSSLRSTGIPVVCVMHELAYPWRYGGWRGDTWALTQRAVLPSVVRACAGILVTTSVRAQWLASRRWLPSRRVSVAPVFSNLPPPQAAPGMSTPLTVGLFGYAYQGLPIPLVLDAIGALRLRGWDLRLQLLGAPGSASPAGETWLEAARWRKLDKALAFTGELPPQELSDAMASCQALLCADAAGPSSRKGSLAGSLASGRPLVAIDGPMSWRELIDAEAVRLVAPSVPALAEAIAELLTDRVAAEALGARGRSFYEREMSVQRTAASVRALLDEALAAAG